MSAANEQTTAISSERNAVIRSRVSLNIDIASPFVAAWTNHMIAIRPNVVERIRQAVTRDAREMRRSAYR